MAIILDKTDTAVSSDLIFFVVLVTNAAAGALGAGLPGIAANAIIWGAAGAAAGSLVFFQNDNLIDAVEFCQEYKKSLRMSQDDAVKKVRSAIAGDLAQVRFAASAFRRLVHDPDQVSRIKLNQQREVVDLWTNAILVEKERKKGTKVGGPGDPGKIGSVDYFYETAGRILLDGGLLQADRPFEQNAFRWVRSPSQAAMPGVPDRARQQNLNRRIGDVPVVRIMRVCTGIAFHDFAVAMSADGKETAQAFQGNHHPEKMQWVLASFLLEKPINCATDEGERLIQANWELGITKCWDQVRNQTFSDLGIKSIGGAGTFDWRE